MALDELRPVRLKPTRDSSPARLQSVQMLRAIAALAVVAFHATVLWRDRSPAGLVSVWKNGVAGVDLFFVISGFIIFRSGAAFAAAPGAASIQSAYQFIQLRLIRLVPTYWAATALKIFLIFLMPARLFVHGRPNIVIMICSFLFIPAETAKDQAWPILNVGWTLSFELIFYLIFAGAILTAIDPILLATPILGALALASVWRTADWPAIAAFTNPIGLEFLLGMLIARLFKVLRPGLGPWAAIGIFALGAAYLSVGPGPGYLWRPMVWGLAAAMMLAGALSLERFATGSLVRALVLLGEASYTLYLVHEFVLPPVGSLVAALHLKGLTFGAALVTVSLAVSVAAAVVVHLYIERPLIRSLRGLARDLRSRGSLAAATAPL